MCFRRRQTKILLHEKKELKKENFNKNSVDKQDGKS